nr:hypothetical protein Iba_chr04bCG20250 [Ipomoea batatas]
MYFVNEGPKIVHPRWLIVSVALTWTLVDGRQEIKVASYNDAIKVLSSDKFTVE